MRYRLVFHIDPLTAIAVFNAALLLIGFVALLFSLVLVRRKRLSDWARKRRTLWRVFGSSFLTSILITAYFQTGWYRHGIGLFVAGLSGLIWTLVVAALLAERKLHLQTLLWLTLCLSLVFAGWTTGLNRSRCRARMIRAIETAGGSVFIEVRGHSDPEVHLPQWSTRFLDTSWDRVTEATIPIESFTPSVVRSWCLDELSAIRLLDQTGQRPVVDSDAIAAIPRNSLLKDFAVFGGTIDQRGLELLAQFPEIKSLAFDCFGDRINGQIERFEDLESLYLTNPNVDDAFIEQVDALPDLFHLDLTNPVFADRFTTTAAPAVETVWITGGTIETGNLTALGSFQGSLALSKCTLSLSRTERPNMPATRGLGFYGCNLTDETLLQFYALPKLEWLSITGSLVTRSGQEAFKAKHPDVAMDF